MVDMVLMGWGWLDLRSLFQLEWFCDSVIPCKFSCPYTASKSISWSWWFGDETAICNEGTGMAAWPHSANATRKGSNAHSWVCSVNLPWSSHEDCELRAPVSAVFYSTLGFICEGFHWWQTAAFWRCREPSSHPQLLLQGCCGWRDAHWVTL